MSVLTIYFRLVGAITLVVVVGGFALWTGTGRWQWGVTGLGAAWIFHRMCIMFLLPHLNIGRVTGLDVDSTHRIATNGERAADLVADVLMAGGAVTWAWTGHWIPCLIAIVVGLLIFLSTTGAQMERKRNQSG
jgi:divalent metal cation (Fe/Co/Zn/Cd) transporter